jgi:hypothetical protein
LTSGLAAVGAAVAPELIPLAGAVPAGADWQAASSDTTPPPSSSPAWRRLTRIGAKYS